MSMNLQCNMVELIQTPTYITDMCMMNDTGTIGYKYTGKRALAALLRYKEWYENWMIECFEYEQESGVGEEVDVVLFLLFRGFLLWTSPFFFLSP